MINWSLLADGKLEAIGPKKLHDSHGETICLALMRSASCERHIPVHFHSAAQNIREIWFVPLTPLLRPSTPRSQCSCPRSRQQPTAYGMRLARGGCSAESARTSLRSGMSPSTLVVPDKGRERRLAAKVRAPAQRPGVQTSATQRRQCTSPAVQGERHGPCSGQAV